MVRQRAFPLISATKRTAFHAPIGPNSPNLQLGAANYPVSAPPLTVDLTTDTLLSGLGTLYSLDSERALAIEKAHLNRFTGEMAARIRLKTLALLGALRRLQGDYVHAENHLQEAVRLAVGEFGETSQESAQALNDLAVLYKYCGRFDEGLRLYKEALRVTIATQGEECLSACTIYNNMGGILF